MEVELDKVTYPKRNAVKFQRISSGSSLRVWLTGLTPRTSLARGHQSGLQLLKEERLPDRTGPDGTHLIWFGSTSP